MTYITEKYPSQLTRPRELESLETVKHLKRDKEFKNASAKELVAMHYYSGYDIFADSDSAKILLFNSKLEHKKDTDIVYVDKYAPTYFIKKGYQSGDIVVTMPDFKFDRQDDGSYKRDMYINSNKKMNIHNRILKHTFSYELCPSKIEKNIKNAIDAVGESVSTLSEEQMHNAYLIKKTIGFSIRPSSSAYVLDIDSKNEKDALRASNTLNRIIEINGANSILFIEKSLAGAYHVVVRFGDFEEGITKDQYNGYIDYMNQNILSDQNTYAKLDKFSNGIRCLFSSTYVPINYDPTYPKCLGEVYSSIFDAVKDFNTKYNNSTEYFKYPCIDIVKEELKEAKTETKKETSFPKEIFVHQPSLYSLRKNSKNKVSLSKESTATNRWEIQRLLIPSCVGKGMSFEETWQQVQNDIPVCNARNDMEKWEKEVHTYYDTLHKKFSTSPKKNEEYISQEEHIPSDIKNLIQDQSFIIQILKNSNYEITDKNIKIISRIITEMYGTFYYDIKNPKNVSDISQMNSTIGAQFSRSTCNLMKDKFSELHNVNVYGRIRSILKQSSLFKKHCNHLFISDNHPNNKCSQWILSSSKDISYSIDSLSLYIKKSFNKIIELLRKTFKSESLENIIYNIIIVNIYHYVFDRFLSIDGKKYILDY